MCLQFGFVIFWQKDFGAKAAHKMLVKLTPGGRNWQLIHPYILLQTKEEVWEGYLQSRCKVKYSLS